jgi:endonuclease YncB( thermonuclease family)
VKPASLAVAVALLVSGCNSSSTSLEDGPGQIVTVMRVLDGDSLVVSIDGAETEVRLLGINTPERDECFSQQAKQRTTELATGQIRLREEGVDRFGRVLGYAFAGEGPLINLQLIDEGLALALSGDHPRRSEFKAAEEAALESRRGRWQPEACGPAHPARIVISDLEPNAPGDDAQNPNGEWVELSNQGSESAPMGGWVLQDESSSHRFAFPSNFMLPPGTQLRIFSGCGDATREALYWCAGGAVWSNGGDTAYLLDPSGNVAARHAF